MTSDERFDPDAPLFSGNPPLREYDSSNDGPRTYPPHAERMRISRAKAKAANHPELKALTPAEIEFVEVYCTNGHNPREAAKEIGYSPMQGFVIYRRPHVLKAIYDRMSYEKLAAPEIVNRVGQLARADMRNYMRVETTSEEEEQVDPVTGETVTITVEHSRVVVDLVRAMRDDTTYPLKSVEFYRTGEVKKITIEDRLQAIQLIGNVYGLFGKKEAGDDGRQWFERARDLGIDPRTALEEMMKIAAEWKVQLPKEILDGQFKEQMSAEGGVEIEFSNPDAESEE